MTQTLTRILLTFIFFINIGLAQSDKKDEPSKSQSFQNGNQLDVSRNRLPELLRDVKVLLSDAFISDVMSDTLEVVYSLNRILIFYQKQTNMVRWMMKIRKSLIDLKNPL